MPEPDVRDLMSVAAAISIVDAVPVSTRVVSRDAEACLRRRLATPVVADRDLPPFDKSLMDGYAARSGDLARSGDAISLRVVGTIAAGSDVTYQIHPGQCAAIMTGAPMPDGADCVVPVESAQVLDDGNTVQLAPGAKAGEFIARRGCDIRAGEVVLARGQYIGPAQLAAAASVGANVLDVVDAPRAALVITGDEIVGPQAHPRRHQIRDANGPMLAALVGELGAIVESRQHVDDDPGRIRTAILAGLRHDVLFISGGMSMGQHDHVPRLLAELGVNILITKLRIKPGKPFIFGTYQSAGRVSYVFGLPGNPVSGFVCTLRLASRLIARLSGSEPRAALRRARLAEPLAVNGPREFYQPAIFNGDVIRPLNWKGSADVFTLASANSVIVRPENHPPMAAGSEIGFMPCGPAEI
jgi:molybdopterin molybdotransferase